MTKEVKAVQTELFPEMALATTNAKGAMALLDQNELIEDLQNSGFENVGVDDVAIPRIKILQSNSPVVMEGSVEGAKAGVFFNTATNEIIKDELIVIPCAFQKLWLEWAPKPSKKLIAMHDEQSAMELLKKCHKNEKGKDITPDGNTIAQSSSHYVVVIKQDGSLERAIIDFASTQIKKSKKWLATMMSLQITIGDRRLTAPMFSHSYSFRTVKEENGEGQWFGFSITSPKALTDKSIYQFAKQFHTDVQAGKVKVSEPIDEEEVSSSGQPQVSDKF